MIQMRNLTVVVYDSHHILIIITIVYTGDFGSLNVDASSNSETLLISLCQNSLTIVLSAGKLERLDRTLQPTSIHMYWLYMWKPDVCLPNFSI